MLRNARGGGWVGICPSVTKRYEGVGGVTSALHNVICFS